MHLSNDEWGINLQYTKLSKVSSNFPIDLIFIEQIKIDDNKK